MRLLAIPRRAFLTCLALGVLSLVAVQGCSQHGDDDNDNPMDPGTPQSTLLTGAFVGSGDGGRMTVTIPLAFPDLAPGLGGSALVSATGTLSPDVGGAFTLTGTYDAATDTLALTGGGYTMSGQYENPGVAGITGDYIGPNGIGGFAVAVGGSNAVKAYCGTYAGQNGAGRLNLIIVANKVIGGLALSDGTVYGFEGGVSGMPPDQTITVNDDVEPGLVLTATATLNSSTEQITNGTWEVTINGTQDDFGTWQGSTACGAP